ncbi:MAG: FAD-binding oxidoreductase [Balneolaceae bacterium]|nr:FAD-binding oxidoreductase [Balneolaceae bacterium]
MKYSFSYWEREEWLKPPDLLVIGGGITGASAALFYKQAFPEKEVLIVDKGFFPEGASTRNAGFACIGSISEHLADLQTSDEDTVFDRIERRWNGLMLLRQTIGEDPMDYRQTGGCEIFTEQTKFDASRKQISWFNRQMKERIGLEDVYTETNFEGYPAIFNRAEGAINSGKMMRTLHNRLSGAGVRTWWNCRVDSVKSGGVTFTNGLEIEAKKIALAVNGFASCLTDLPVKPARGYIFVTHPIPGLKWKGTFHYDEGYIYFRNIGDRLLLGGARNMAMQEETTDQFGVNVTIKNYLTDFAREVLKLPENRSVDLEWSGIMGMTENKEPIIKQIVPGVWAAAGLSGMGIAIGMQVARELIGKIRPER